MRKMSPNARRLSALTIVGTGLGLSMPVLASYPDLDVRGRLMIDYHHIDEDEQDFVNGFNNRRARIGVTGDLAEDWDGRIEVDYGGGSLGINDFRMRWALPNDDRLWIGQYKVPMGFQELTSSRFISLIERSSPSNVFTIARRVGVAYEHSRDTYGIKSMFFGSGIGDDEDPEPDDGDFSGDQPLGLAARGYFAPHIGDAARLHLGLSVAYEDHDDPQDINFHDRPELRDGDGGTRILGGEVDGVEDITRLGLEAVYAAGPLTVEAEYLRAMINNDNGDDPTFDGWHIQGSYMLTGETCPYSPTGFGAVVPNSTSGAWELAARISNIDLNDSGIDGGEQQNFTLGVNYYVSEHIRIMGNVVFADVDFDDDTRDDSPTLIGARAQWWF
ncbi:porin [Halorhodospira halochloris]|uniref:OprO/OprP family phosphate-selective porin n=1 Tax=Halorhodospira halochloris TaxID=1052 RepID=UPI001EE86A5A|nr:porin [Halorhodospira halochloris]MCG5530135.1 porin [Halorhodospira halochloris]